MRARLPVGAAIDAEQLRSVRCSGERLRARWLDTAGSTVVLRRRFSDEVCDAVLESRWWERPVEDLLVDLPAMLMPLTERWSVHPLLHAYAA